MINYRAMRLLRSTLAHIDSAIHALLLSADAAHQNDNQSLVRLLEVKGGELLLIRNRIENDLRDLEAQVVLETKGQWPMPRFTEPQWRAIQERHAAEVDGLRKVLSDVRLALGTPDDVDICQHARQLAAAAAQWHGVPWKTICELVQAWQLENDMEDAMLDMLEWYDRSKPPQVTA